MNEKNLFYEQQKFRNPWFWILTILVLGIPIVIFMIGLIKQVGQGIPFGNKPASNTELIVIFVLLLLLFVTTITLSLLMRLETIITTESVSIKLFPLHRSFKNFKWEDISEVSIEKNTPMKFKMGWHIGGWGFGFGMRIKLYGKKIEYCIAGNKSLHLQFKNGKQVLIGTGKQYEMEQALKKVEQLKNRNHLNTM
jgi:hypothetical protein